MPPNNNLGLHSNEPGYYEDGAFGIRIENLVFVKEANTAFRYGGQSFFCFERLTMCPMSTKLMDTSVCGQNTLTCILIAHAFLLLDIALLLSS